MHASALIALGLLLFAITLSVLAVAKLLLMRVARREGTRT
jgi:phosphate transport system permease protein